MFHIGQFWEESKMYYNKNIPMSFASSLPNPLIHSDGSITQNPSQSDYINAGWLIIAQQDIVPAGQIATSWNCVDNGNGTCSLTLLRKYFGDNAETNTNVTVASTAAYFMTLANPTAQQVQDQLQLNFLFSYLSPLFGNDMNNVPWSTIP